ncbi:MAG: multiheme c-type cytochrome [Gammaproteobacteria bacterium]
MKIITLVFMIILTQSIFASTESDADLVFNWAETNYPQYFAPANQASTTYDTWYYRYYPDTDNYLGVNTADLDIYVLGASFNGELVDVGKLQDFYGLANDAAHAQVDLLEPERCTVCHADQGSKHQAVYNEYSNASRFGLTIDSVTSTPAGGTYDVSMTVTITKDGAPFTEDTDLASLDQKRFFVSSYNSASRTFGGSGGALNAALSNPVASGNNDGKYTVTAKGLTWDPNDAAGNAVAYAYIADGKLDTEGITLYADVANAGKALGGGAVVNYDSPANVSACEGCHGKPYLKHGYRAAKVSGLGDFAACKNCHLDDKAGGHEAWQVLVDNPVRHADLVNNPLTSEEKVKYAYKRTLMNDVHMSHAMEFPFPQSMKNCATCHAGKLDRVLSDDNFKISTCKSCHALEGGVNATGDVDTTTNALVTLANEGSGGAHPINLKTADDLTFCNECHGNGAKSFSEMHNGGYNPVIYADTKGTRYSDAFTVSIDAATYDFAAHKVTFTFNATENADVANMGVTDIKPTVMIGLYGYDTKHYVAYTHGRDFDDNGNGVVGERNIDFVNLEYVVGTKHPRFTTDNAAGGSWTVTVDLSAWSDKIAADIVRRIEIGVLPTLKNASGTTVALNAPSRTFSLISGAFDDSFYPDIVKVDGGCNNCHDALATTFHSADRGGNIKVCRMCHAPLAGGAHLELQSRSIDSFVHAIHSFAPFDIGDIDLSDPVLAERFSMHIDHTFPNFTIKNCMACHNDGMFEPPRESISLPGILSGSDPVTGRNIGNIPSIVTGPGARACGACHRQHAINEDNLEDLNYINEHTKTNGYAIENFPGILDAVVEKVGYYFQYFLRR